MFFIFQDDTILDKMLGAAIQKSNKFAIKAHKSQKL